MAVHIPQFVVYLRETIAGPGPSEQLIVARQFVLSQQGEVIAEYRDGVGPPLVRSELHRALDHARRKGVTLIIPHFDQIARQATPLALLRDSGVKFVALDLLDANQTNLQLLEALAANQAAADDQTKAIQTRRAERSKPRPQKARRTTKPRTPPSLADRRKGAAVVGRRARQDAERLGPRLRELRDEGLSLREIAACIFAEGETTRAGRPLSIGSNTSPSSTGRSSW